LYVRKLVVEANGAKSDPTVSAVAEALPRVVCPVTPRVPATVALLVTVEVPIVADEARRLVVEAFTMYAVVVVELPTMRLVILARVARSDEKNPLVEVLFVVDAFVATRLVVVAKNAVKLVVEAFVRNAPEAVIAVAEAVERYV
jgi:hypothetical protein